MNLAGYRELQSEGLERSKEQLASIDLAIDRAKNMIVGHNTVMQIVTGGHTMYCKYITDGRGKVLDVELIGSPLYATHLTPQDGKRQTGNIRNGRGDTSQPVNYLTAYRNQKQWLEGYIAEKEAELALSDEELKADLMKKFCIKGDA